MQQNDDPTPVSNLAIAQPALFPDVLTVQQNDAQVPPSSPSTNYLATPLIPMETQAVQQSDAQPLPSAPSTNYPSTDVSMDTPKIAHLNYPFTDLPVVQQMDPRAPLSNRSLNYSGLPVGSPDNRNTFPIGIWNPEQNFLRQVEHNIATGAFDSMHHY
jgi:hypothetical protein